MNNDIMLVNKIGISTIISQPEVDTFNSLSYPPLPLTNATNRPHLPTFARRRPVNIDQPKQPMLNNRDCLREESASETARIDFLYSCASELKNNISCLVPGNSIRYVRIEQDNHVYSVGTKTITLPSGKQIQAGLYKNRLLVSDGEIYHLESPALHKPMTPLGTATALFTYFLAGQPLLGVSNRHPTPPANTATSLWQKGVDLYLNLWSGWRDPLLFPVASASVDFYQPYDEEDNYDNCHSADDDVNIRDEIHNNPIWYYASQLVALRPNDPPSLYNVPHAHDYNQPTNRAPEKSYGALVKVRSTDGPGIRLVYNIDDLTKELRLPGEKNTKLLYSVTDEFSKICTHIPGSIDSLIDFDIFMGKKIVEIFNNGLFYTANNSWLDMLMLKREIEDFLHDYRFNAKASDNTLQKIDNYIETQIVVSNYVGNSDSKMVDANQAVFTSVIVNAVEAVRNKGFERAITYTYELLKITNFANRDQLNSQLKLLHLMHKSYLAYSEELVVENVPPIERIIYNNDKDIFKALIFNDYNELIDALYQRHFYYIFEYTRINNISVHSSNFIMPGEVTALWQLFLDKEKPLDAASIKEVFFSELKNFIDFQQDHHPLLDQLEKFIELTRLNEKHNHQFEPWYVQSLVAIKSTYSVLTNMIDIQANQQKELVGNLPWYNDFLQNQRNVKNLLLMLVYVEDLQHIFNQIINEHKGSFSLPSDVSPEQRLAAVKIATMKTIITQTVNRPKDEILLSDFEHIAANGHADSLVKASAFWYLSHTDDELETVFSPRSCMDVLKKYAASQYLCQTEYQMRTEEHFTSIYSLLPSSKLDSLEDYYKQFLQYKVHDAIHEARSLTARALNVSNLHYLDIINPPKEIYTFQIFSRNYVVNTLYAGVYVSVPYANHGYVSLVTTHTGRLFWLSTIGGLPFTQPIDPEHGGRVRQKVIKGWTESQSQLSVKDRNHITLNDFEFNLLFAKKELSVEFSFSLMHLVVRTPETQRETSLASAYSLAPIRQDDILKMLHLDATPLPDKMLPLTARTPLIDNFDYLNQASLVNIADSLKEKLRDYTWIEFIAGFIPFFEPLYQHWHDEQHQFQFNEIMFDFLELIGTLAGAGVGVLNFTEITIKQIITKAITQNITPAGIRKFIVHELKKKAPKLAFDSTARVAKDLAFFIVPFPISKKLFINPSIPVRKKISDSITLANSAINKIESHKKQMRGKWKTDVDFSTLQEDGSGKLVNKDVYTPHYYIKNDDYIFQIEWDSDFNSWRIINPLSANPKDYAIAVAKNNQGHWLANSFNEINRGKIYSTDLSKKNQELLGVDAIQIERTTKFNYPENKNNGIILLHKELLRFFLYRHADLINLLKGQGKTKHNDFLYGFKNTFKYKKELVEFMKFNPNSHDPYILTSILDSINNKEDSIVRIRSIAGWRSPTDINPEVYFALSIDISHRTYIIDLREMREGMHLKDHRDVFTHKEWCIMYKQQELKEFELIKYKDFDQVHEAKYFSLREANSPGHYIQDGYLLNEPYWYKPLVISHFNRKLEYGTHKLYKHSYRSAVRSLRHDPKTYSITEHYPIALLHRCGKLDNDGADQLYKLIENAKKSSAHAGAILTQSVRLDTINQLLLVNEGKLVAFYSLSGRLEHLLLSIGAGRFTGVRNSLFDVMIPNRPTVIIAEHVGVFDAGILKTHSGHKQFRLKAGNAFGVDSETPVLANQFPQEPHFPVSVDGKPRDPVYQDIPRGKVLLGEDYEISRIQGLSNRLRIRVHGAPFNVNRMDAIEFADVIRGLPYLDSHEFRLSDLESIELYSCHGGYGNRYSTAQILADELNIKVKAYPHKISEQIRQRRPEWFNIFTPRVDRNDANLDSLGRLKEHAQRIKAQKMHQRLHDLMILINKFKPSRYISRLKRDIDLIPTIYFDLLEILIHPDNAQSSNLRNLKISQNSQDMLKQLLEEYDIQGDEDPRLIEQAFLDILLSIDEFSHLATWFSNPN